MDGLHMNYSPTALVWVAQCKNKMDLVHMNRLNYLEYNNPPFLISEYCVDMLIINARNELYSPSKTNFSFFLLV